jgi:hypothetical protein
VVSPAHDDLAGDQNGIQPIQEKRRMTMALPEWLLTFLLSTLLPWVISLVKAYIDSRFRPKVSAEGWTEITGFFQKMYDEAAVKGYTSAQAVITEFFAPVLQIAIITAPDDPGPVAQKALMFKDMAEAASELQDNGTDIPAFPKAPIDSP